MSATTSKAKPKTVVKKAAVKKTSVVKKTTSSSKKTSSKKVMVYADNARSFWVSDGQILNSLEALAAAFATMSKTVYGHHVAKDKHDFAQWVEVVLCDSACAADLRKAKTPQSAATVVARHLKTYLG